jgi:hypothetical protein
MHPQVLLAMITPKSHAAARKRILLSLCSRK